MNNNCDKTMSNVSIDNATDAVFIHKNWKSRLFNFG